MRTDANAVDNSRANAVGVIHRVMQRDAVTEHQRVGHVHLIRAREIVRALQVDAKRASRGFVTRQAEPRLFRRDDLAVNEQRHRASRHVDTGHACVGLDVRPTCRWDRRRRGSVTGCGRSCAQRAPRVASDDHVGREAMALLERPDCGLRLLGVVAGVPHAEGVLEHADTTDVVVAVRSDDLAGARLHRWCSGCVGRRRDEQCRDENQDSDQSRPDDALFHDVLLRCGVRLSRMRQHGDISYHILRITSILNYDFLT